MIVVSDASPLNYLVLIGQIELLQKLYSRVLIPPAVHQELQQKKTPAAVRTFIADPPAWLEIHHAAVYPDTALSRLDIGEREAIALTEKLRADAVLIDERDGRRLAEERHLMVIGTLQILSAAADEGLIDFPTVAAQLQTTNFRMSTQLLKTFLDRDAQRKNRAAITPEKP